MQKLKLQAQVEFPAQAAFLPGTATSDQLNIFLHGYRENSEVFYKRIKKHLGPKNDSIFLNGPFPMPTIRGDIVLYQFAWYFYNPIENNYYIDFQSPINYIKHALEAIIQQMPKLKNKKLNIIGYSQGGYLAPFLGQELSEVKSVYCINGSIREDLLGDSMDYHLIQIHAELDDKVEIELAKKRYDNLSAKTLSSTWETIEGEKHFLSDKIIKALEKYGI